MSKGDIDIIDTAGWEAYWPKRRGSAGLVAWCKRHTRHSKSWRDLLTQLMDAPGASGPIDVVELGCAPGRMLLELHQLRPDNRYNGVELASSGLRITQEKLAAAGVRANLHLGDVRAVEIPPMDLAVSFGLVEHFTDPAEIIYHHRRLLRPGGVGAVTIPNYAHPVVVALATRFTPETVETHYFELMSEQALRRAFAEAGFSQIRTGSGGSPLLPSSTVRPGVLGASYRFAARSWNLCTSLGPGGWPWPAFIWATGVNPD